MEGTKFIAIAKEDLELTDNPYEKWIKGKSYEMIADENKETFHIMSESGFFTHYTQAAVEQMKNIFEFIKAD